MTYGNLKAKTKSLEREVLELQGLIKQYMATVAKLAKG
jgi:hypothetical protein